MIEEKRQSSTPVIIRTLLLVLGLGIFIYTPLVSFLLFHSLAELFSIIIAAATFLIVWNTRDQIENSYLLFLGIALLPIAGLDLFHTLSYKGMNIFPDKDANLPTQLWIAARSFQAVVMVTAPFLIKRRLHSRTLLFAFLTILLVLLGLTFSGLFPDCYIEGQGLTGFKVLTEYAISAVLMLSLYFLYRRKDSFEPQVLQNLTYATITAIVAELAFTFYIGVYDLSNIIGHLFKVISFWFLYKALVETSLRKPIQILLQNQLRSEAALRKERDFSTAVFNSVGALIVVLNENGKIVRANKMFEHSSQLSPDQFLNKTLWELPVLARDANTIHTNFERAFSIDNPVSYQAHLQTEEGYLYAHRWTNTVIRKLDGSIEHVIAAGIDITEQKAAEERLRYISTHDTLTGLYNRTFFEAEIGRLQNSRLFPISIIMADLDNLKGLNDSQGHAAGDAALKELARIFTTTFRSEDIIARIGGDEFVVLLPETDVSTTHEMISRIYSAHEVYIKQNPGITFGFSLGSATAEAGTPLVKTLETADKAMYTTKKNGQ